MRTKNRLIKAQNKPKLPRAQVQNLAKFYGFGGDYREIIEESELNPGTIILYLNRAISQEFEEFFKSLDKLYDPKLKDLEQTNNLNLIRAFKYLNDLYYDNDIKLSGEYGVKKAVSHWFHNLGRVDQELLQGEIRKMIKRMIKALSRDTESSIIKEQKEQRRIKEKDIVREIGWRLQLDLPLSQIDFSGFNNVLTSEAYLLLNQEVRNIIIIDHAKEFKQLILELDVITTNIEHYHHLLELLTVDSLDALLSIYPFLLSQAYLDVVVNTIKNDGAIKEDKVLIYPVFLALPSEWRAVLHSYYEKVESLVEAGISIDQLSQLSFGLRAELLKNTSSVARLIEAKVLKPETAIKQLSKLSFESRAELFKNVSAITIELIRQKILQAEDFMDNLLVLAPEERAVLLNYPHEIGQLVKAVYL